MKTIIVKLELPVGYRLLEFSENTRPTDLIGKLIDATVVFSRLNVTGPHPRGDASIIRRAFVRKGSVGIPKGWRKLDPSEPVKAGDKCKFHVASQRGYLTTLLRTGEHQSMIYTYIRKIGS